MNEWLMAINRRPLSVVLASKKRLFLLVRAKLAISILHAVFSFHDSSDLSLLTLIGVISGSYSTFGKGMAHHILCFKGDYAHGDHLPSRGIMWWRVTQI